MIKTAQREAQQCSTGNNKIVQANLMAKTARVRNQRFVKFSPKYTKKMFFLS